MKQIIYCLLFSFIIITAAAAQENQYKLFSTGEIRFAYGKRGTFGISSIFGISTDKMRSGLGLGYEETLIKIDDKDRSYAFLPIILRNEILSQNKLNTGLCMELGYRIALMKKYEARSGGYYGFGLSFLNGKMIIMYRRQLINVKNEKNLLQSKVFASLGMNI